MGGKLDLNIGPEGGMAARAAWVGQRSLRLLAFDMRALMDLRVDFDESGGARVRARSPAYGIDAEWKARRD